jgi:hypothetical protein
MFTFIEQLAVLPLASVTVQVIVDNPRLNSPLALDPEPLLTVAPVI